MIEKHGLPTAAITPEFSTFTHFWSYKALASSMDRLNNRFLFGILSS